MAHASLAAFDQAGHKVTGATVKTMCRQSQMEQQRMAHLH
jgi:hypothetical protein